MDKGRNRYESYRRVFFRKIRGDLSSMLGRLIVLGLAVGVGVLVLSAIAGTASTLLREMSKSYEATMPATATLEIEEGIANETAARFVGGTVTDARAGDGFSVRFRDAGGAWRPMVLFAVPDLADNRIAKVFPEPGTVWPPAAGSIAVERTALPTFGLTEGTMLTIRFNDGSIRESPIGSVVHDPAVAPANQERTAYGYVDENTARLWGLGSFHELKVRFAQNLTTGEAGKEAVALASRLTESGFTVTGIMVPPVHRHPHQSILMTLLGIFGLFGLLTVILCSLLVSNVVSALTAKEKRWIGVMKTLGASPGHIATLVLAPVVFLSVIAVVWSVPLGILASTGFTGTVGRLLNLMMDDTGTAWWAYAIPAAIGFLVPLLLASVPVRQALNLTILESISDVGTERVRFAARKNAIVRFVSRTAPAFMMTVRNTFRKKRRLALSLLLLGIGGGLFLTSFNLTASWKGLIAETLATRRMDLQIRLVGRYSDRTAEDLKHAVPGIMDTEIWTSLPATSPSDGGIPVETTYPDMAHGSFRIVSLPIGTRMIAYEAVKGRWLEGTGEAVLNQAAALRYENAAPGDTINLVVAGKERPYVLAGIVREIGQAAAYVAEGELSRDADDRDFRTDLLVRIDSADASAEKSSIEAWLEMKSLPVEILMDNGEYEIAGAEHFGLLIAVIMTIGLVTGLVGWLGIASVLGLAVLERRREFGILRSIGAAPGTLLASIAGEAALMTVLGTIAGFMMSLPLTAGLGDFLGNLSMKTAIPLRADPVMSAAWLALSLPAGIMASLNAGLKAARTSVRETLALL